MQYCAIKDWEYATVSDASDVISLILNIEDRILWLPTEWSHYSGTIITCQIQLTLLFRHINLNHCMDIYLTFFQHQCNTTHQRSSPSSVSYHHTSSFSLCPGSINPSVKPHWSNPTSRCKEPWNVSQQLVDWYIICSPFLSWFSHFEVCVCLARHMKEWMWRSYTNMCMDNKHNVMVMPSKGIKRFYE